MNQRVFESKKQTVQAVKHAFLSNLRFWVNLYIEEELMP